VYEGDAIVLAQVPYHLGRLVGGVVHEDHPVVDAVEALA
jgi:hypothetical protein